MVYPKPLSKKALERKYNESGISDEVLKYLHTLFKACANLYGHIELRDMWVIHKRMENVPTIQRKQLVEFAGIARRDGDLLYCVFEADELWDDVRRSGVGREIVHKDLVGGAYRKLQSYYELIDWYRDNYPFYIPENLLDYAEPVLSEEELAFQEYIENLEVTADTSASRYGHEHPCENKGKRLKEFSFQTESEKFLIDYYKNRPARQAAIMQECSGTEAEKLLRKSRFLDTIGREPVEMIYKYMIEELIEVGVQPDDRMMGELLGKFAAAHNNSHLWCLFGWTPNGLREAFGGSYPTDEIEDDELERHLKLEDLIGYMDDDVDDEDFDTDWIPVQADEENETDLQRRMRERGLRLID